MYESGYYYLLLCAIRYGKTVWAHELSRTMLEYAFRVETCTSVDVSQISELFHSMLESDPPNSIYRFKDWALLCLPRQGVLHPIKPFDLFIGYAIFADLKALVEYELKPGYWADSDQGHLFQLAATGQRLSSSLSSRESMLRHLIKLGCPVDIPFLMLHEHESLFRTLLSWVLRDQPHEHISEDAALSLARILLENGANQEAQAFSDPALQGRERTVLYSCILHNNVKAVELLLAHEADTSVIDQELMFTVWTRERFEGGSSMLDILRKNVLLRHWNWNTFQSKEPSNPMGVLPSGCFASIGSSQIGESVAWSLQKTWGDTRPMSIVN